MVGSSVHAAGRGASSTVYDSAVLSRPLVTQLSQFWRYRSLTRLLVTRDVLVRYKRSLLGVWWTLLNPVLTMTVMWLVFSHLFHVARGTGHVPFVVYLLSGVIVILFLQQGVQAVASSVLLNTDVLRKVYVPPEVFCLSAGLAGAINLGLSAIPLLVFQLALGTAIPWTIVLVPIPVLTLTMFVVGFGLTVAAIAVRFHDMLELNNAILLILGYFTPVFYPITIVPHSVRRFFVLNPVYHDLNLFRNLIYLGTLPSWQTWFAAAASGLIVLTFGLWVFARSWRTAAGML